MEKKKIFIDFDGVIFDSERRVVERKKQIPEISWNDFFEGLDWFKLLEESQIINNVINYIIEGQNNNLDMSILTKVHTLNEMQAKTNIIRTNNIELPILFVPPHVSKSSIYVPSDGKLLIDDSIKNLIDWEKHGGTGIYFNEELEEAENFTTVKSLRKVLKR